VLKLLGDLWTAAQVNAQVPHLKAFLKKLENRRRTCYPFSRLFTEV